ncbi:MAG: hypothetical protein AAFQ52_06280, partial [Chloroflexota bacterium]
IYDLTSPYRMPLTYFQSVHLLVNEPDEMVTPYDTLDALFKDCIDGMRVLISNIQSYTRSYDIVNSKTDDNDKMVAWHWRQVDETAQKIVTFCEQLPDTYDEQLAESIMDNTIMLLEHIRMMKDTIEQS